MMQDTSLVELNTKENENEKKIILHDKNGNIYEYDKENNNIVSLEEYVEKIGAVD